MTVETETAINAAVLGASGYTGAELLRLMAGHPRLSPRVLTADRAAGRPISETFPHLGHLDLPVPLKLEDARLDDIDIVFCALPHGVTQETVARIDRSIKVVDLSADFRLEDPDAYAEWYGGPHRALELQSEAVYGLPEFYREALRGARLAANTGCYVATTLLGLIPLLSRGLIAHDPIVVDAASGVSGAGRAPKEGVLFCEVSEGYEAYGVGRHRHMAEIDQELTKAAGGPVTASFTPHLLPQNRGILATIYVRGDAEAIHGGFVDAYAAEPFIQVLPIGRPAETRHVRGSNFVHIGVVPDRIPGRTIVFSALDNLVKGASGQAIQNANIMLGLDETSGLTQAPLFP